MNALPATICSSNLPMSKVVTIEAEPEAETYIEMNSMGSWESVGSNVAHSGPQALGGFGESTAKGNDTLLLPSVEGSNSESSILYLTP